MTIKYTLTIPHNLLTDPDRLTLWISQRIPTGSFPDLDLAANSDGKSTLTYTRDYADPDTAAQHLTTFFRTQEASP